MGEDYAHINLMSKEDGLYIEYAVAHDVRHGNKENQQIIKKIKGNDVYFRVEVSKGAKCQFSYSENGKKFTDVGDEFTAVPGRWIGAKVGIFALREDKINDSGYANYDWFRFTPLN